MDTTDVDTRFGDVFPVWFIAGLTDGDMTRPVSLEFGAAVLVTHRNVDQALGTRRRMLVPQRRR